MSFVEIFVLLIFIAGLILIAGQEFTIEPLVDRLFGRHTEKWRIQTDPVGVLEQIAEVRQDFRILDPKKPPTGKVFVRGELWSAIPGDSRTSFKVGESVRIVGKESNRLIVERASSDRR